MTAPFISTDDLGLYVGQDLSASDLAVIVCDAACERIRSYTDQLINYVECETVVLDGTGNATLRLPQMPVNPMDAPYVELDGVAVDAEDFVLKAEAGLLIRSDWGDWTLGVGNVSVTYSHGWEPIEANVDESAGIYRVPADLRAVALKLAADGLVSGRTGLGGVSGETIGGYSYTIDLAGAATAGSALDETDLDVLEHYRRVGVA